VVPRLPLLVTIGTVATLVLTACGGDDSSSSTSTNSKAPTIEVSLTDKGCEPNSLSAASGPTTFHVTNDDSAAVTEFEVLDGSKILGEVENVAPGLDRSFSLTLKAGKYTTKCTNGSKEKGTLEVANKGTGATGDSTATNETVDTYLAYVTSESAKLTAATQQFVAAVKAGDVNAAKQQFAAGRYHYETIEPIAESFGDLDPAIDARQGDVPDAQWTGFHRIEQALFVGNSTAGMAPVADQLMQSVQKLQARIPSIKLEPAQIANGAVELLNEVSASKITGEEDRYSHTDLSDFHGNVAGAQAAFKAVQPLLAKNDAALSSTIEQRFTDVFDALDAYKDPASIANGYALYSTLDQTDTRNLSVKVDALAEPLSQVAAIVIQ
jgi:iron uptake system component EfeO